MVVVFGAFIFGDFVLMKMLGFALAVAVLLDATVMRLAISPALLTLAGRWNWWPGNYWTAQLLESATAEGATARDVTAGSVPEQVA
jgi:RND superfamily putative drug exporter